eukprot:99453_1
MKELFISFTILFGTCLSSVCYEKWEGTWPHCSRETPCFNGITLSNAEETCNEDGYCIGFSFDNGSGCYKDERYCVEQGFGYGNSHDYYGKCSKSALHMCYEKSEGKSPVSYMLSCFNGITLLNAQKTCSNDWYCIGFTWTWDNTQGCYIDERYVSEHFFDHGDHSYYAKCRKSCYEEWVGRWPNCGAVTPCFDGITLLNAQETCNRDSNCIGFSFNNGSGCYKDERYCVEQGFGYGNSHDYYGKCSKSALHMCYEKSEGKSPVSYMLSCFNGITLLNAQKNMF